MECQMTCLMTCFCAVSFKRRDQDHRSVLLEKPPLAATQPFSLRTPCSTDLVEHPAAAGPRPVIDAGQKCPQFCGIGRSWMLNKLHLELVLQKI